MQVLGLRTVLAHKGCALACFLRHSYLIEGFQLHRVEKFYCVLLEFGMKKNQLIGCSQILAEIIYWSKLPAEVETPMLSLFSLVTPSYPQVLQNTLTCSL